MNYRPRRPDDSLLRQRLRELAAERRRFGYRRLGWMLQREGHAMNHKKLYRLYREEQLMVRRRRGRKRALGTRAPMMLPEAINQRWSSAHRARRLPAIAPTPPCDHSASCLLAAARTHG